jgi:hypothetical protein
LRPLVWLAGWLTGQPLSSDDLRWILLSCCDGDSQPANSHPASCAVLQRLFVESSSAAAAGGCRYEEGWCFTTLICEQGLYIPWLMERALRAGVSLQCRTIQSLQVASACAQSWDCCCACSQQMSRFQGESESTCMLPLPTRSMICTSRVTACHRRC